jgi:hypothetical protein
MLQNVVIIIREPVNVFTLSRQMKKLLNNSSSFGHLHPEVISAIVNVSDVWMIIRKLLGNSGHDVTGSNLGLCHVPHNLFCTRTQSAHFTVTLWVHNHWVVMCPGVIIFRNDLPTFGADIIIYLDVEWTTISFGFGVLPYRVLQISRLAPS